MIMCRVKFILDHTQPHNHTNIKIKSTPLRLITHLTSITHICVYMYMYIYILADAIVHHMITVTCMPDKMSNEKEKKREREKEKIKGKEK